MLFQTRSGGWRLVGATACVAALVALSTGRRGEVSAQAPAGSEAARAYDELLDLNVRDGMVYYRALKSERARLDRYVTSIGATSLEAAPREDQLAFWINAYNALVLQTVVEHYPIARRTQEYPAQSIRQIPGAFERLPHRVAGRMLTLDQIEQTILPAFQDPRVYLVLGRGAVGGGRLRSEAYTAAALDRQLGEAARECVMRAPCVQLDAAGNTAKVSAIFSWREKEFVAAYAGKAPAALAARSPLERAVFGFVGPALLAAEQAFVSANGFRTAFEPFDWSLNDLTGR